ncbi:SIS domain-containing protein [Planotetraspora sp. A-T 1434]|uniref:D-sedoheptulose-7-phosphate isomerase n=1 Tax=Planotetraspora sp. A-T 1434 TaxID=2979219 RepID=UPI0021C12233|nr:SIS domain-containing protein [Planotetraspora sp. A-T 1434]MCT9932210.1 SIS domain-containing protein [Planotetraspora sp. A-T 1434]
MSSADDSMESLYPFLYSASADLDRVLTAVRQSTVDKANEIVALRQTVADRDGARMAACAEAMAAAFSRGARLFAFGNGGSSTDAQDVAALFLHPEGHPEGHPESHPEGHPGSTARPLPAFALTADIAVVTALSNDIGFEVVFARQLAASGRAGDIAFGLSTSGNSRNLIAAFEEADRRGMITVGLAGYDGGQMAELGTIDHLFVVPSSSVHRIQEAQTTVYHALWELTQDALTRLGPAAEAPVPPRAK